MSTDTSTDTKTQIQGTVFSVESSSKRDDSLLRSVGPGLCTQLRRVLRLSELLGAEHNQVTLATREFAE